MKKIMSLVGLLGSLLFIATPSYAGGPYTGTVTGMTTGSHIVYFTIDGAQYAGCSQYHRYVINTQGEFGKNSYAMLLSAYMAGKPVMVFTSGQCNTMPNDAEDVDNVGLP